MTSGLVIIWLVGSAVVAQDDQPIEPQKVEGGRDITFETDVLPILRANCIACHNKKTNENELILETIPDILKGGSEGPSVIPGKPDDSLLYRVAARSGEPVMPPLPNDANARALTPRELGILRRWIVEGSTAAPGGAARKIDWRPISERLQAVHCADYHEPSGTIAASRSNRVDLYDLYRRIPTGRLIDPGLPGAAAHRDIVQSIAFHPIEPIIATGGYRSVKFWKRSPYSDATLSFKQSIHAFASIGSGVAVALGNEVRIFKNITDRHHVTLPVAQPVTALAFRADVGLIACDMAGRVTRWPPQQTVPATSVELRVGPSCIAASAKLLAAGTSDGRLLITPLDGSSGPEDLNGLASPVQCMVFAGASRLLAGAADGTVVEWNVATRKLVSKKTLSGAAIALAVSPDGQKVAAATEKGGIVVWNLADGKQLAVCKKELRHTRQLQQAELAVQVQDRKVSDRTNKAKAAKAEVDSQTNTLAAARATVKKARKTAADALARKNAEASKIDETRKALAAKPADKGLESKLKGLTKSLSKLLDADEKAHRALESATKDVSIIEAILKRATQTHARQQQRLAEMTADRDTARSDLAARKKREDKPTPPLSIRFDTNAVLSSVDQNGSIHAWDVASGRPLSRLAGIQSVATAMAADAGFVALDKTGRKLSVLSPGSSWVPVGRPLPAGQIAGRVRALAFSSDGRWLAVGSGQPSRSGQLQIWDTLTRKLVHSITDAHSDTVLDVEFSSDNRLLLSCGADKFAKSWSASDGSFVQSYEGHTHHVLAATWQADMTRVATGGGDNLIKVWDAETGELRRTITTHQKHVTGLQFVGSAEDLISGSGDGTMRNFTASTGRLNRSYSGSTGYIHCIAASASGDIVVAGTEDGSVRVWNGHDGKLLVHFEADVK